MFSKGHSLCVSLGFQSQSIKLTIYKLQTTLCSAQNDDADENDDEKTLLLVLLLCAIILLQFFFCVVVLYIYIYIYKRERESVCVFVLTFKSLFPARGYLPKFSKRSKYNNRSSDKKTKTNLKERERE